MFAAMFAAISRIAVPRSLGHESILKDQIMLSINARLVGDM